MWDSLLCNKGTAIQRKSSIWVRQIPWRIILIEYRGGFPLTANQKEDSLEPFICVERETRCYSTSSSSSSSINTQYQLWYWVVSLGNEGEVSVSWKRKDKDILAFNILVVSSQPISLRKEGWIHKNQNRKNTVGENQDRSESDAVIGQLASDLRPSRGAGRGTRGWTVICWSDVRQGEWETIELMRLD